MGTKFFNDQLKLPPTRRCMPKWWPPKPNLRETIQDIINLFETKFKTKTFQDGMAKSFVSTFCFPKADGSFVPYSTNTHKQRGTIKVKTSGTTDEFVHDQNKLSLAECLALSEEIENDIIADQENNRAETDNDDISEDDSENDDSEIDVEK